METLLALCQVVLIDLALAGDNALVIAAIVAMIQPKLRTSAMVFGIGLAIVLRLFFSLCAAWLMAMPFIGFVGGFILLYIAWKLFKNAEENQHPPVRPNGLWASVGALVAADVSMSLDNVLGVAGAAGGHVFALIGGLILSMVLMGVAANWVAGQMQKRPWLIYLGIAAIVLAALRMIISPLFHLVV